MVRTTIKNAVFGLYSTARSLTHAVAGTTQVSILLYHRVNDELKDSVTVGVKQFEEQMKFVSTNYKVCTVDDIISRRVRPSKRPVVALTFDDGYLDNYTNAAPILRRYGLPCAFFVSTGIIGTTRAFPHDREKLGRCIPAMSWDQVRELHQEGFTIGSHTVSHVNLAQVTDDVAHDELSTSRTALQDILKIKDVTIAYPYGKRSDITPSRLASIQELGYVACFSGCGGVNYMDSLDRFDLKRMNVDFRFTLQALKARINGWNFS